MAIITRGSARAKLALGFAWAAAARSGLALAGFIGTVLLTRLLPADQVGIYFIASAIALMMGPLASLSLREPTVLEIAAANAVGDRPRAVAVARSALGLGALSGITVAAASFAVWYLLDRLGRAGALAEPAVGFGLAAWMAVLAIESQLAATLQGLEDIRLTVMVDGTIGKVLAMIALAIVWVARGQASLPEVMFLVVASELLSTCVAAQRVHRALRQLGPPGQAVPYAELWHRTWPYLLHQITANIAAQADIMLLGMFWPTGDVARYGTAARLASLPVLPVAAINVPIAPTVARLRAQSRMAELQTLLQTSAAGFTAIAAIFTVLWITEGGFLLEKFFGHAYRGGAVLLVIMGIGQCVNLCFGQCMLALAMTGEQRILTKIAVVSSVLKAGLIFAAAVSFGSVAVAVASTAGNTVALLAGWWTARGRLGIYTHARLRLPGRVLRWP